MHGTRKRLLWLLVAISVGSPLALLAGLAAISHGWQRQAVTVRLERLLSRTLDAEVEIGALEGVLHRDPRLSGLSVRRAGRPAGSAERLEAQVVGLAKLWPLKLRIAEVRVWGARIEIPLDSGSKAFEPGPIALPTPAWPGEITIDRFVASEVSIRLLQEDGEQLAELHVEGEVAALWLPALPLDRMSARVRVESGIPGGLVTTARAELRLEDGVLHIDGLDARGPAGNLAAKGSLRLAGALDQQPGELTIGLRLPRLGALEGVLGVPLEGSLELDASVSGTLAKPRGEAHLRGSDLVLAETRLGGLEATLRAAEPSTVRIEALRMDGGVLPLVLEGPAVVRVRSGRAELERAVLRSGDDRLTFSGGLGRDGFAGLRLEVEPLHARTIVRMGLAESLGGSLRGFVRLDGPWTRPRAAGEIEWSEPAVHQARFEVARLKLIADGDWLQLDGDAASGGLTALTFHTRAPREDLRRETTTLDASFEKLDIALLAPFLPALLSEPAGYADGSLSLRPGGRIRGSLAWRDGSLRVEPLREPMAPILADVTLSDDAILIDRLVVGADEGMLRVGGRIDLLEGRPGKLDLSLALSDLRLVRAPVFHGTLAGQLEISGTPERPTLQGSLELSDAELEVPEEDDPELQEIRVIVADQDAPEAGIVESTGAGWGELDRAELDLRLRVARGSRIRGRGAELQVEGEVALRKRPAELPSYTGQIESTRGTYRLHGRSFDVERGIARFDGSPEPDPLLDVRASHRTGDIRILALLTGRASAPALGLRSEPSLPEADVLSYLVFGRPAAEVASPQQDALESVAGRAAAGIAATQLTAMLNERLPIPEVDVRIEENGGSSLVDVGARVTDDVTVRYGHSLDETGEERVQMEVRLTPRWSIRSEIETDGTAGADLIWNLDY